MGPGTDAYLALWPHCGGHVAAWWQHGSGVGATQCMQHPPDITRSCRAVPLLGVTEMSDT